MEYENINKVSLCFLLKKTRTKKNGLTAVIARITVNGKRCKDFPTSVEVDVSKYATAKVVEQDKQKGKVLRNIRADVEELVSNLQLQRRIFTADEFWSHYNGDASKQHTFLSVYEEFLGNREKEFNAQIIEEGTLIKHKSFFQNLKKYFLHIGVSDLALDKVSRGDFQKIKLYFLDNLQFENNYVSKILSTYKAVLQYASDCDYTPKNPFSGLTLKKVDKKIVSLTVKELKTLEEKVFGVDRIQHIADCFIFGCYTGLSFADMELFTMDMILDFKEEPGEIRQYIHLKARKKTDVETFIPLFDGAKRILDKYKGILPMISNQNHNLYLKEIQVVCGFNKVLTTHIARKTFATQLLNNKKVPYETVSKLLAHSDLMTAQKYYTEVELGKIMDDTKHIK